MVLHLSGTEVVPGAALEGGTMDAKERPFLVDLRGLKEGRHEYELTASGAELDLTREDAASFPDVVLDLTLTLTGRLITARGVVGAHPSMTCARCLEPFVADLEGTFEVVIRLLEKGPALEDEEDTPAALGEDWVAFDVSAREALLLAMPLKPLCREDCRGLCPQCGTNLNQDSCSCEAPHADARWDALKSLLE